MSSLLTGPIRTGRTVAGIGSWLGILSGAALVFAYLDGNPLGPTWLLPSAYVIGALMLMVGALMGRKALSLNAFMIVVSCVVATAVPILFLVLAWSLNDRYNKHELALSLARKEAADA